MLKAASDNSTRALTQLSKGNREEDLFGALTEYSPQPVLVTNSDAEIVYVNHAWEKLLGYTLLEVKGKNPHFLQSGKTSREYFKKMWKTLKAGKPFKSQALIDKKKNSALVYLQSTVYPFTSQGERYYVQMLEDITQQKKLESFQKNFIQVAAHDIRSPLASLQLINEMAMHDERNTGEMVANFKDMQDQITQIDQLTRALLSVSLFETGKMKLNKQIFELSALIEKSIPKKAVFVTSFKKSADVFVNADPVRIAQVVSNLVENAVKYSPKGSRVGISLKVEKRRVVVSVQDAGNGISAGDQKKIFTPFYRTSTVRSSAVPGAGLGLYIIKEIIKVHRGKLSVQSKIGEGSMFSFTLPLASAKSSSTFHT